MFKTKIVRNVATVFAIVFMSTFLCGAGCDNVAGGSSSSSGGNNSGSDSSSESNRERDSRLVGEWEILDGGEPRTLTGECPSGTFRFLPDGTCSNKVELNLYGYGRWYNHGANYWNTIGNSKIVFCETIPKDVMPVWTHGINYSFIDGGKLRFYDSMLDITLIKKN